MKKAFICKRNIGIIIGVIILLVCLVIFVNQPTAFEKIEYRTDIQPLLDRFEKNINITSCYWKADTIGKTSFGPSSYWIKGFILIDEEDLTEIVENYKLTDVNLQFEDGMNPSVTKCRDFSWYYSKELSREFIGADFMGEFYIDINHGILYFDLESM